jgi:hypothetical protein
MELKPLVDTKFKLLVDTGPVIGLMFAVAQPVTVYTIVKTCPQHDRGLEEKRKTARKKNDGIGGYSDGF